MNCNRPICVLFLRHFQFPAISKGFQTRSYASNNDYFDDPGNPKVALTKDHKTIVMYHPQESITYDKTIPIPRDDPRYSFPDVESLVRERLHEKDIANRPLEHPSLVHKFPFYDRDIAPTALELADMFHTSKHPWFRKYGKRIVKTFKIPE